MEEIWKDIKGFEGKYQVSNLGLVRSLDYTYERPVSDGSIRTYHNKGRILKMQIHNRYLCVGLPLGKRGKNKTFRIHRLVAETFIPNPHKYPAINHKDEVTTNNRVDNLEWCTYSYNNSYGDRLKRLSKSAKKRAVEQLDENGNFIRRFESIKDAALTIGCFANNIIYCCQGRYKKVKGTYWRYADE